jgi:hypothetical protein
LVAAAETGQSMVVVSGWTSQLGLPLFFNVFDSFDTAGQ